MRREREKRERSRRSIIREKEIDAPRNSEPPLSLTTTPLPLIDLRKSAGVLEPVLVEGAAAADGAAAASLMFFFIGGRGNGRKLVLKK